MKAKISRRFCRNIKKKGYETHGLQDRVLNTIYHMADSLKIYLLCMLINSSTTDLVGGGPWRDEAAREGLFCSKER